MRIDSVVESVLREVFTAVVARAPGRFNAAAADIGHRGEGFAEDLVTLAVAVDSTALLELFGGEGLTDGEMRGFARHFVESERWSGISEDSALAFLRAISGGERRLPDTLPPDEVGLISMVLGGWMLSAFAAEDELWTDFLDETLKTLKSTPVES
jgi:hypothetical protein